MRFPRKPTRPKAVADRSRIVLGLLITWLALGAWFASGAASSAFELRRMPPVLILTLDTLRADHLGSYGYHRPTSPVLDDFAGRSTRFADVTCSMPTTLPSHLSIFTGLTPWQHGVHRNGILSQTPLGSLFEQLATVGVPSRAVVAAKVLAPKYLDTLGLESIDYGDGSTRRLDQVPAQQVTDRAIELIAAQGRLPARSSFALWLHYFDPHEPYEPPADIARRFAPDRGAAPVGASDLDWLVALNDGVAERLEPSVRQRLRALYDAEIYGMDRQIGRLFDALRRHGLWKRSLIVVVGDHGQALGEGGFWGHGERLSEPVIKVPLMIKLPGQKAGRVVAAGVETIDLYPTLVELLGLESASDARPPRTGRSLAPALFGESIEARRLRVVERRRYPSTPDRRAIAIVGQDWKLVNYRNDDDTELRFGRRGAAGGLDGRPADHAETLAASRDQVELLARVERRIDEALAPAVESVDDPALRSLGYVD